MLRGAAADLERDIAFWVFIDALDEYVESVEPRRLGNLPDEVGTELARVFPALAHLGRGDAPGLQGERYRINRAVRELLERLAATKPLVLILDDFHWADPASVDLLGSLLRRPPSAAVLLVLAARPHQGPTRPPARSTARSETAASPGSSSARSAARKPPRCSGESTPTSGRQHSSRNPEEIRFISSNWPGRQNWLTGSPRAPGSPLTAYTSHHW